LQRRPVELQVLSGCEVAVSFVVGARNMCQHAHLPGRQRAIGNGDAQHVGVELEIDAVHQPEWLELRLRDLAGKPPFNLIAELGDAGLHEGMVEFVVAVHPDDPQTRVTARFSACLPISGWMVGPAARMRSRRRSGRMAPSTTSTSTSSASTTSLR